MGWRRCFVTCGAKLDEDYQAVEIAEQERQEEQEELEQCQQQWIQLYGFAESGVATTCTQYRASSWWRLRSLVQGITDSEGKPSDGHRWTEPFEWQ